jgi:hypothetical protein
VDKRIIHAAQLLQLNWGVVEMQKACDPAHRQNALFTDSGTASPRAD